MKNYTNIIKVYDKNSEHYAKSIANSLSPNEFAKFVKLLHSRSRVLDVGCAAGRDSRRLKDSGFEVIGIDLSKELLKIARRENPEIDFISADMVKTPFEDDYFDGIWANAVLHHLDKKEMDIAILEFKRILKKNGVLFIKTKMGKGVLKTEEQMVNNEKRSFTLLEKDELNNLLTSSGFEEIELYSEKAHTRELYWLCGFYRKI